jgi:hypothetical protein
MRRWHDRLHSGFDQPRLGLRMLALQEDGTPLRVQASSQPCAGNTTPQSVSSSARMRSMERGRSVTSRGTANACPILRVDAVAGKPLPDSDSESHAPRGGGNSAASTCPEVGPWAPPCRRLTRLVLMRSPIPTENPRDRVASCIEPRRTIGLVNGRVADPRQWSLKCGGIVSVLGHRLVSASSGSRQVTATVTGRHGPEEGDAWRG